jgi:hypothetical protein
MKATVISTSLTGKQAEIDTKVVGTFIHAVPVQAKLQYALRLLLFTSQKIGWNRQISTLAPERSENVFSCGQVRQSFVCRLVR